MGTREAGLLSFISSTGSYNTETLEKDLNNIRFIYMDRGYWKIFVGKPEVLLSPNKTDITINIPIQEENQYKAGTIDFTGDLIFNKSELKENLETEESEVFSYGKLQRDIKRIETKYGDKGYGFVNVIPKFFNLPSDDGKTIHVMFDIRKGEKVRIGKIHITGNSYTRDKVIRREIRIFEGGLYSETNKSRSAENIQRLGFFDDVKIIPKTIKNRDDLMDMEVAIKERENTGTLEVGASYNGYYGFSFTGKVHKFNLFGRGYNVGFDVNLNFSRQFINLNFSDPYFLDSKWYLGTDFYFDNSNYNNFENSNWVLEGSEIIFPKCQDWEAEKQKVQNDIENGTLKTDEEIKKAQSSLNALQVDCVGSFPSIGYRGFSERKISGGITLGRSLTDTLRLLFYYRLENVSFSNIIDNALYPLDFANGLRNPIETIIEYDDRNDRLFPTNGIYSRGSITYDGIIGKFNYFTLSANTRFYQNLFWNIIFRLNVQYSHHIGLENGAEDIPFDRLFLLGGINSLRGFEDFSVGAKIRRSEALYKKAIQYDHPFPKKASSRVFGGTKEFYSNIELQFPIIPGAKLFGVLFIDVGTTYDTFDTIDWRSNWGAGLRMFSPIGPVRLEIGLPFEPRYDLGEQNSEIQFTIGLPF